MKGKLHALILGTGDDGSRAARIADSVQIADQFSIDAYSPEEALAVITGVAQGLARRVYFLPTTPTARN